MFSLLIFEKIVLSIISYTNSILFIKEIKQICNYETTLAKKFGGNVVCSRKKLT